MDKVAIVILNWNGEVFLKKYLPGIISSIGNERYKLYVADNCSSDGSQEYLKTVLKPEQIIVFDSNYGYAGGYAKALNMIKAEYFVLLNSDVEITPNWIDPVIREMDNDKTIAAAMPKIKREDNREYFEYAGAAGGFIDRYGFPFCRGRILQTLEKDTGQYDEITEIFWASGACMFVRAQYYFKSGGLDPLFFAHMEEIDLCWRLKNMGYKIVYIPHSTIYHVGGGTLPNNSPRKLFLNYRNNLTMLRKNLPEREFRKVLLVRLILDFAASLKFLFTFSLSQWWAVCKSYIYHIKTKIEPDKSTPSKSLISTMPGGYEKSILVNYFFRRKKFFSDLDI